MDNISRMHAPVTSAAEVEFSDLGVYEPGFIHLNINTLDDLKILGQLSQLTEYPEWTPTFLHEYIHFLQDLTTTHGLLNFIHAVEHLKNANKMVLDDPAPTFPIPLRFGNQFNWELNKKLKKIYRGCETPGRDRVKKVDYLTWRETPTSEQDKDGQEIIVSKFEVQYFDPGAVTNMWVHFGSIHIKEYMAHIVQCQFEPQTDHDDLPYRLVGLIVDKEVPKLAVHPAYVIALCDASLMHFHPAELFFHTLQKMKEAHDWIPTDVDSVYSFTLNGWSLNFEMLYLANALQAFNHFRDCLKEEIFTNNVAWFNEMILQAITWRLSRRGFFTSLVEEPQKFSALFYELFATFGLPFTTNSSNEGVFIPPRRLHSLPIHPYYPKVFQAVSNTYNGKRACSMKGFCETLGKNGITNNLCDSEPWSRVALPKLCPYAQMWRTWGLGNKRPLPPDG